MDDKTRKALLDMAILLEEIGFGKYDPVNTMSNAIRVLLTHADVVKEVRK